MSVLRQLVDQQLAITPSMEAVRIELDIIELNSQAKILGEMLPNLAEDNLSMESKVLLDALGYSPESTEKKSLLTRVWEHIKRIFATIREKLTRLFSMRKHYLQNNQFTIEKLRKYASHIPAMTVPEGMIKPRTDLLSPGPGKVKEEAQALLKWSQDLVRDRAQAIRDLSAIHFDLMDNKQIDEARGKALHYVEKWNGEGAALVNYTINRLTINVNISRNDAKDHDREVNPASVVLMHTLLTLVETIGKEDGKLTDELAKSLDSVKTFQASVDAFIKKKYADHNGQTFSNRDMEMIDFNNMKNGLHGVNKLADDIVGLLRLSHYRVIGDVTSDIIEIVRKSLGAYKLKNHELLPEDQK